MPGAIGLRVERRAEAARHLDLLAQLDECRFWQTARKLGVVEAVAADRLGDPVVEAALEQQERIAEEVVGAEKVAPHADRPGGRGHVEREALLDLVQQVERVAGLAIELVDESDDRHVAQAAHLEELAGLLLDALGGVEHHDRTIDGGQRAVGVLAEILVARSVQQIEGKAFMLEAHHCRRDRDTALALDRHPIRARPAPLALTSPASWIAPPNSSNFSVKVVLPASGCEMIAKVRRRAISSVRVGINRLQLLCRFGRRRQTVRCGGAAYDGSAALCQPPRDAGQTSSMATIASVIVGTRCSD